jgi:intron-binding protein aquarius
MEKYQLKLAEFKGKAGEADEEKKAVYASWVNDNFPFTRYFSDAPKSLFGCTGLEEDSGAAMKAFKHINGLFEELESYRAFELLRTQKQRTSYLLMR